MLLSISSHYRIVRVPGLMKKKWEAASLQSLVDLSVLVLGAKIASRNLIWQNSGLAQNILSLPFKEYVLDVLQKKVLQTGS